MRNIKIKRFRKGDYVKGIPMPRHDTYSITNNKSICKVTKTINKYFFKVKLIYHKNKEDQMYHRREFLVKKSCFKKIPKEQGLLYETVGIL